VSDGAGFSVLAKISIFPSVDTLTPEVWGAGDPLQHIIQLCEIGNGQALDLDSWDFATR
jgi:hypothetical protein